MKFTGTGIPPTEAEIQFAKRQYLHKSSAYFIANLVFNIVTFIFLFYQAINGSANTNISLKILLLGGVGPGTISMLVILLDFFLTYFTAFNPIETRRCAELLPSLDQPIVADYCRQVAMQGRKIVGAELDAIVENEEKRRYWLTRTAEKEACNKVYSLINPTQPNNLVNKELS